jgi:hypothetical protein
MSVVSFCAVDARLLRLENTDLKRELADARQALALQRQRTAEAERQIAALRDVQARAWRVSLMYFRPTAEAPAERGVDCDGGRTGAPAATASSPLASR